MELIQLTAIACALMLFDYFGSIDAQRVSLAVQLETMQNEISQLRSDVDTLIGQVRELRGEAGLASTTPPTPTEGDPADYIYAHCRLLPNAGIQRDLYEPIAGNIDLKQKVTGGQLYMKVNLYGFQTPNSSHGMHAHSYGDLRSGCETAGGHYNPQGYDHGGPDDEIRHIGDFGNIAVDEKGSIYTEMTDNVATLTGQYSIVGRTIVIHAGPDDLGRGGNAGSRLSGNAGVKLGCCVVGLANGEEWQ